MSSHIALIHELRSAKESMETLLARITDVIRECEAIPPSELLEPCDAKDRAKWIHPHAIDRYKERTGSKAGDEKVRQKISDDIRAGIEMELKPKFKAVELISHGKTARFFQSQSGLIYAVEDEMVITVHHGTADRWRRKQ